MPFSIYPPYRMGMGMELDVCLSVAGRQVCVCGGGGGGGGEQIIHRKK